MGMYDHAALNVRDECLHGDGEEGGGGEESRRTGRGEEGERRSKRKGKGERMERKKKTEQKYTPTGVKVCWSVLAAEASRDCKINALRKRAQDIELHPNHKPQFKKDLYIK